jgi:hypothetical protein
MPCLYSVVLLGNANAVHVNHLFPHSQSREPVDVASAGLFHVAVKIDALGCSKHLQYT